MWAHTLVNDFAQGVFPGVGDILTDPAAAAIALRHIIIEGYIGDATPGYDGNPDRTHVAGELNEDGDAEVSDDATPAIAYGMPPDLFFWETFIGRAPDGSGALTQPLPASRRRNGRRCRSSSSTCATTSPRRRARNSNIQQAVDNFNELQGDIDDVVRECSPPPTSSSARSRSPTSDSSLEAVLSATPGPGRGRHRGDRRRLPCGVGGGHRRRAAALGQHR